METHTRKNKMKHSKINSKDLISKLPDPLLHHILSFLDMRHAIETCILSRRWRYVWISLPILNFVEKRVFNLEVDYAEEVYGGFDSPNINGNYLDFVRKVLYHRGASKINEFHLSCEVNSSITLDVWMPMLARSEVELIDLKLNFRKRNAILKLPKSLLGCQSLTTLKLDMGSRQRPRQHPFYETANVRYDIGSPLCNLKTLHLRSFWLLDGVNKFIGMCRSLETLVIANCTTQEDELRICHDQLNNLVIEEMSAHDKVSLEYCKVTVYAPNLKSFSCRDYPINQYSFEWIPILEKADVDTDFAAKYYSEPSVCMDALYLWDYIKNVMDCLRGLQGVRSLALSVWLLEIAIEIPEEIWDVEVPEEMKILPMDRFSDLRCLTLKTSFSTNHIYAAIKLLMNCSVLETLVVKLSKLPADSYYVYDYKVVSDATVKELAPQCEMHNLKLIEFHDVEASNNELKFLKFLLRVTNILEKVVIYTSKKQSLMRNQRSLKRFSERLMAFPRASSKVIVEFPQLPQTANFDGGMPGNINLQMLNENFESNALPPMGTPHIGPADIDFSFLSPLHQPNYYDIGGNDNFNLTSGYDDFHFPSGLVVDELRTEQELEQISREFYESMDLSQLSVEEGPSYANNLLQPNPDHPMNFKFQ